MKKTSPNKGSEEYERFDNTMRKLMQVPHSEIKAKLDAEKAAKLRKPKTKKAKVKP